jgi:hypothetical protein
MTCKHKAHPEEYGHWDVEDIRVLLWERTELRVQLGAALSEIERLREDAERYRWLRSEAVSTEPEFYDFWNEFNTKLCREERLDDLIDSTRKA